MHIPAVIYTIKRLFFEARFFIAMGNTQIGFFNPIKDNY